MRLLLGFGSKARQGKDLAGQAIETYFNSQYPKYPQVKIFKFADALYDICRKEYGMTTKDPALLQRVGKERRQQEPTYWIDRLRFDMGNFNGVGIITDVRYQNEAWWIKSFGGFVINVTRLNDDGTPFISPDRDPNHVSECELDNYNFDGYIKTHTGEETLAAEQAITAANYFYQMTEEKAVANV